MAYTPYTPVPAASLTANIDLPDDAELETSGIGALNAPLEELADRIAAGSTLLFAAATDVYGTSGSTIESITNDADYHVFPDGISDADHTVSLVTGDAVHVMVSFGFGVGATDATVEMRGVGPGGSGVVLTPQSMVYTGTFTHVTLHCVYVSTFTGDLTFTVRAKHAFAVPGDTWIATGQMVWTSIRLRGAA